MRGARIPAWSLILLLAAPYAAAGSEASPEVDDEPDRVAGQVDLLAMWFSNERDGIRITWKLADLRSPANDAFYFASFRAAGKVHLVGVGLDEHGTLHGYAGPDGPRVNARGIETFANLTTVSLRTGAPGYVTASIPHEHLSGLKVGASLIDITGGTDVYERPKRSWVGGVDVQSSTATFRVATPPTGTGKTWMAASTVVTGTAAMAGITLLVARRTHAPAPPELPQEPAAATAPSMARFRLTPPHPPGEGDP